MARSGYVNLLQPQDRRSPAAGDAANALDARRRLLDAGVGRALVDAVAHIAATLDLGPSPAVVDLGCGTGEALARIVAACQGSGIGVDLSVSAIDRDARAFPQHTWVVANADRRLPFVNSAADLIVSINARRNPSECARVLKASGRLLVAVPAEDDLVELRTHVHGAEQTKDRGRLVMAEHAGLFSLERQDTVRARHTLPAESLRDLLAGTYLGARHRAAHALGRLEPMAVTLASDVLVFVPRKPG